MTQLSSFSIPQDLLNLAMRTCFNCTVSVFWGEPDRQPGMNNASGVLLKLDRPLLLTAEHVIRSFLERRATQPSLKLQIAEGSIDDISERIIGKAHQPDLVTLDLTGIDIQRFARHLAFHVNGVASCNEIFFVAGLRLPADSAFGSPLSSFPPSVRLT